MAKATKLPILVSWVGSTDISAMKGWRQSQGLEFPEDGIRPIKDFTETKGNNGPLRTLSDDRPLERQYLLFSDEFRGYETYIIEWVKRGNPAPCIPVQTGLANPSDYVAVYESTEKFFQEYWEHKDAPRYMFNLTPGTPATQAVLLYMSEVRYPGGETWRVERPGKTPGKKEQCFKVVMPFRMPMQTLTTHQPQIAYDDVDIDSILKFARVSSIGILLLGETGVGKSLTARLIHERCGGKDTKFVAVNCAALALNEGTFRAELFGAKKGAYTGATTDMEGAFKRAEHGTLFLDEIGELPLQQQAALLRALQERTIEPVGGKPEPVKDVRIICATNRDLLAEVQKGTFREDLYYRIATCSLTLPPLRAVKGKSRKKFMAAVQDILKDIARQEPQLARNWKLSPSAAKLLLAHDWPGNYRELHHTLLLGCVEALSRLSGELDLEDIRPHIQYRPTGKEEKTLLPGNLEEWLETKKRAFVRQALAESGNKVAEAARRLGMTYQKLDYYLKAEKLLDD